MGQRGATPSSLRDAAQERLHFSLLRSTTAPELAEGRLSPTSHMHLVPCVTFPLVMDAHLGRATCDRELQTP